MEDILEIFSLLFETLSEEILDYYYKCQSYIKDLFIEKNIDLNMGITYEVDDIREEKIRMMVKIIRLVLTTFGVSKKRLMADDLEIELIIKKKGEKYPDYNSYYLKDLKHYINKMLLEIIIEYLVDLNSSKLEDLVLYFLIPQNFILKLNQFRKENINHRHIDYLLGKKYSEIEHYINPTDLEVILIKDIEEAIRENIEELESTVEIINERAVEEIAEQEDLKQSIWIVCPICRAKKILSIPASIINQERPLSAVLIPKDLVCEHTIQAFVDRNFKVRGYQKIDYKIE